MQTAPRLTDDEVTFYLQFRRMRWSLRQVAKSAAFLTVTGVTMAVGAIMWFQEKSSEPVSELFTSAVEPLRPYFSVVIVAASIATVAHAVVRLAMCFHIWVQLHASKHEYAALRLRIADGAPFYSDKFRETYMFSLMMEIAAARQDRRWLVLIGSFVFTCIAGSLAWSGSVPPVLQVAAGVVVVLLGFRFYSLTGTLSALESDLAKMDSRGISA